MSGKNVQILGKNNFVDPSADNVFIVGNDNNVRGDVSNVFIQGSGYNVTSSDTHIIDGVVLNLNTKGRGSGVLRIDSNTDLLPTTRHYIIDSRNGDVTIDFRLIGAFLYPGMQFTFKKEYQPNVVILDADSGTIDGETLTRIKNKGTDLRIMYEGGGRFYII